MVDWLDALNHRQEPVAVARSRGSCSRGPGTASWPPCSRHSTDVEQLHTWPFSSLSATQDSAALHAAVQLSMTTASPSTAVPDSATLPPGQGPSSVLLGSIYRLATSIRLVSVCVLIGVCCVCPPTPSHPLQLHHLPPQARPVPRPLWPHRAAAAGVQPAPVQVRGLGCRLLLGPCCCCCCGL